MSTHSFKFHFEGEDFYPSVSVMGENKYKVHFYKPVNAYNLPQTFMLDTQSSIVIAENEMINESACTFIEAFKRVLTEHLQGIQQRF